MNTTLASKPQFVTRHLGGLSAIRQDEMQSVIWSRRLASPLRNELGDMAGADAVSFVTLSADPFERVQHQLRKAGVSAHHLTHDIALLVTVFGELSGADRITVRLQPGGAVARHSGKGLRMVAAYETNRRAANNKAKRLANYVGIFRDESFKDHPLAHPATGLRVSLERAVDTPASRRGATASRFE